jgi:hypothetical protein
VNIEINGVSTPKGINQVTVKSAGWCFFIVYSYNHYIKLAVVITGTPIKIVYNA